MNKNDHIASVDSCVSVAVWRVCVWGGVNKLTLDQLYSTIRKWSDDTLQDCFASMFRDSSNDIEYTTSVTTFINKCNDNVVPTVTVPTRSHGLQATSAPS
jgi:N-acetylneuraminic acid mutarotase